MYYLFVSFVAIIMDDECSRALAGVVQVSADLLQNSCNLQSLAAIGYYSLVAEDVAVPVVPSMPETSSGSSSCRRCCVSTSCDFATLSATVLSAAVS
jgi:hypothetical protein